MKKFVLVAILVTVFCFAGSAMAIEFDKAMGIATKNFPVGIDAAGNTDAAALGYSSNNPASVGYKDPKGGPVNGTTLNYGVAVFKKGPLINTAMVNGLAELPFGNVQLSYGHYNSFDRSETAVGLEDRFQYSPSGAITFARLISSKTLFEGDKLYGGASFGAGTSRLTRRDSISGITAADEKNNSLSASLGMIYQPIEKLAVGMYWDRTWNRTTTTERYADTGVIFANKYYARSNDDRGRIGVSYQLTDSTRLAVDAQYISIDRKSKIQIFSGVEQCVSTICAYGGWANSGPMAGVGIDLSKTIYIGVAYMYNPFPEMKAYYGNGGQVFMGMLSVAFGGSKKQLSDAEQRDMNAAKAAAGKSNNVN